MSTLSIITITVIAAFLIIFLIAALSGLIYVYLTVRKQLAAQISSLSLTTSAIGAKFDTSQTKLELLIANVHGDKIEKAAQVILEIVPRLAREATRIEQCLTTFRQTLEVLQQEEGISGSAIDRARQSGLLPDSYAPAAPDEHFVTRSKTAAEDAIAFAEESADNTSGNNSIGSNSAGTQSIADILSGGPPNSFRTFGD